MLAALEGGGPVTGELQIRLATVAAADRERAERSPGRALTRATRGFLEGPPAGSEVTDAVPGSMTVTTAADVHVVSVSRGRVRIGSWDTPAIPTAERAVLLGDRAALEARDRDTMPRGLTRDQIVDAVIANREPDGTWPSDFVDRQVREVRARLFALEPDPSLVRLLRTKASGLSPSEVRASLGRLRASFDFPVVAARPAERIAPAKEPAPARTGPPAAETLSPENVGDGTPWRHVTLAMLIDAGLVSVPLDIEHRYHGTRLTGRIEDASRISFGGVVQGTLSMAGAVARQSVNGPPRGRPYWQTNGRTFWQYRRADGTLGVLDELRRQLHEGKVVSLAASRRAGASSHGPRLRTGRSAPFAGWDAPGDRGRDGRCQLPPERSNGTRQRRWNGVRPLPVGGRL
jgi:hypothetical protein